MDNEDLLFKEQCGSLCSPVIYSRQGALISRQNTQKSVTKSCLDSILGFFREVLLPLGYPDSVSEDYFAYQLWDTIQAFCSTITSIFTTQAILKGVGVGNAEASALSATITWIMKDGTGMIGRIIFAWCKGSVLDCECKKWRLFADILNDGAMLLELFIPYISEWSLQVLCVSTGMKAVVGVAGGATRASITNHQAIKGNMAEISAKDGSQETLVNLVASFTGIFLLNYFTEPKSQWIIISALIIFHIYANYKAVTSLIFKHFNNLRITLVLKSYLVVNAVLGPESINKMESVFLGFGSRAEKLCGFKIMLGKSIKKSLKYYSADDLKSLTHAYRLRNYLIIPDLRKRILYVAFEKDETPQDIISGYYNAILLGLAICFYNKVMLDIYSKRQLHQSTPITRISTFMKNYSTSSNATPNNLPQPILQAFNDFVDQEMEMFFTALHINGWKVDSHALHVDEWRSQWKELDRKDR